MKTFEDYRNVKTIFDRLNINKIDLINLEKNSIKGILNEFKKGDVICCFAGYPYLDVCVLELTKDITEVSKIFSSITNDSLIPSTSHVVSSMWFKIN